MKIKKLNKFKKDFVQKHPIKGVSRCSKSCSLLSEPRLIEEEEVYNVGDMPLGVPLKKGFKGDSSSLGEVTIAPDNDFLLKEDKND